MVILIIAKLTQWASWPSGQMMPDDYVQEELKAKGQLQGWYSYKHSLQGTLDAPDWP